MEKQNRFRLENITPLSFANETCEAVFARANADLATLTPVARATRKPGSWQSTPLWKRVFCWVEYAQTGHSEFADLLDEPPVLWDERMVDVVRAAEARKAIDAGDAVTTAQIALLSGLSHIQVGNFVRAKRLAIQAKDSSGYLFAADVARQFLIEREVPGFAATRRKARAS